MAYKRRPWTLLPHGQLTKIEDNLWAVENNIPGARFPRRMSIIRLKNSSLLFFHAIPIDDTTIAEIKSLGYPEFLVIGHDQHAMDAEAFREKLGLKAYCPKDCEAKSRERVEISGTLSDIPHDDSIDILSLPGTKHGEAAIVVKSPNGHVSLLVSDVIMNVPKEEAGLPFRIFGFTGGPKIVPAFRRLFVKDKDSVKKALNEWANTPGLSRLVPFHGHIIETNAAAAVRGAAAAL